MLVELNIKNFAIIDNLNISFSQGFNVITGETGSGKSVIIDAIGIVLGSRASRDLVRTGCEKAVVEGLFYLEDPQKIDTILKQFGLENEADKTLLLTREIFSNGRSVSRINGRTVTLSMLNNISKYLVDIHGQYEHQSLLNWENHINFVDSFGDKELLNLKEKIKTEYKKLNNLNNRSNKLNVDEIKRQREIDLLKFQLKEIDNANLNIDEEHEIYNQYNIMKNIKDISEILICSIEHLNSQDYNDFSIIEKLNKIYADLNQIRQYDSKLDYYTKKTESLLAEIEDLYWDMRNYYDKIEFDEEKLFYLEERINTINELKRKYGSSIKEILEYRNNVEERLNILINSDKEIKNLKDEIKKCEENLYTYSNSLSKKRKKISIYIEKAFEKELNDLNMKSVKFKVGFQKLDYFSSNGFDRIEFLISTNPGEELKPLTKVISGGEMSRIMLAFKSILAKQDEIPCLIFDEIDVGISGNTAQIVGRKIYNLSLTHQIICVSHLPQIAVLADTHFNIYKLQKKDETFVGMKKLNYDERIIEMANLTGGSNMTNTARNHAKEMLQLAKKFKNKKI